VSGPTTSVVTAHSSDTGETYEFYVAGDAAAQLATLGFQDTGVVLASGERVYCRPSGGNGPISQPDQTSIDTLAAHMGRVRVQGANYLSLHTASTPQFAVAWARDHPTAVAFAAYLEV
jgi:hypothetical protein